jgi:hypothetical protein
MLTSANPDFNESLAGPRQTGTEEMGVSAKACVQRSTKAMRCAARFLITARLARVIAVDVPHHVTQRGNARRFILDCDADRMAYLNLLRQNIELHGVGLIGYCLMSNHVHLVVTPHNADGLGLALRQLNCCALDSFRLFTVSSPQIEERPI